MRTSTAYVWLWLHDSTKNAFKFFHTYYQSWLSLRRLLVLTNSHFSRRNPFLFSPCIIAPIQLININVTFNEFAHASDTTYCSSKNYYTFLYISIRGNGNSNRCVLNYPNRRKKDVTTKTTIASQNMCVCVARTCIHVELFFLLLYCFSSFILIFTKP